MGEVELGAIVVDVGRELRWDLVVMGEVELGAIVVDVGRELRWDLVVMGEVELGAIVVDMDEFWAQEETVGEFVSCGCS